MAAIIVIGWYLVSGFLGIEARNDAIDEAVKADSGLSRHNLPCWPWWLCVLVGPLTVLYYEAIWPWWRGLSESDRKAFVHDMWEVVMGLEFLAWDDDPIPAVAGGE